VACGQILSPALEPGCGLLDWARSPSDQAKVQEPRRSSRGAGLGASHHSGNPNLAIDICRHCRRRRRHCCRRRRCCCRRCRRNVSVMYRRVEPKIGADSASINALLSLRRLWLCIFQNSQLPGALAELPRMPISNGGELMALYADPGRYNPSRRCLLCIHITKHRIRFECSPLYALSRRPRKHTL
jgi:hypothetical protein